MKNYLKVTSVGGSSAAFAIAFALTSLTASAQVIQLTGGDPSGGLTLTPSNVVDAIYTPVAPQPGLTGIFNPSGSQVFQGVTFNAVNSNVTRGGTILDLYSLTSDTASNAGFTNSTPSTEDSHLLSLVNGGLEYAGSTGPAALTLSIAGLTPGASYQVDSLISLDGYAASRTDSVAYDGGTVVDTLTLGSDATHNIYDIRNIVTADSSGNIVVDYSGNAGPFYNALVVQTYSVPEPSTWAMMLGGLGILFVIVRRRNVSSV